MIQSGVRFAHAQRSRITDVYTFYFVGVGLRGKERKDGKATPIYWNSARFSPSGFDVVEGLKFIRDQFRAHTGQMECDYLLPDTFPPGAKLDEIQYFMTRPMKAAKALKLYQEVLSDERARIPPGELLKVKRHGPRHNLATMGHLSALTVVERLETAGWAGMGASSDLDRKAAREVTMPPALCCCQAA